MNELQKIRNIKKTENGDISYKSTGDKYLDILFMSEYFQNHLDEVPTVDNNAHGQLFAMFIRDPRLGLGRRDLGRVLMSDADVAPQDIVRAGRFDDLLFDPNMSNVNYLLSELRKGNELAKKWMPRLTGKDRKLAKAFCKQFEMSEKDYRALIKCESTVEYKLSYAEKQEGTPLDELFNESNVTHPLIDDINFEHVPSLAMIKYYNTFSNREDLKDRFTEYLDGVKKGKKKLNTSVTNVYDIYKNRDTIDADLFFDKLEKIKINCIPILDTSGSMWDSNDSIGKAMSIAHYLSKCSTYCNGQLISFSSKPSLITIKEQDYCIEESFWGGLSNKTSARFGTSNKYSRELNSMYTGDCSNTDFGKTMELLENLQALPEYLVVLSDMEFDSGSYRRKERLKQLWEEKGYTTKVIWWNFNSRNKTVPETDEMGNIYLSGYSPLLLKYLEAGFDGKKFLDKLLDEYKDKLYVDNM